MNLNRKKTIAGIAIAALLAIIAKAALGAFEKQGNKDGEAPAAETTFSVTTHSIEPKDLSAYIELNGIVDADNTVEVYPEIGGKYVNQRVQLGTKVNKGDIIANVDPSKPGSPYSYCPIRAPISGTVTSLTRRPGSTVTTDTVVAKIGDIEHLQVRLQIPEREIADMRIGLTAKVGVEAYPDVVFPASVYRISPLVDSVSHTKDVFLRFDRDDSRINAGMFAKIKLFTRQYTQCIAIPDDSVISRYDKSFVFVIAGDDTVSKREIEPGVSIDGSTIVKQGLSQGERIVVQGANVLTDGAKIRDVGATAKKTETRGKENE